MQAEPKIDLPEKESRKSKFIKLLIKIVVTVACFWYIAKKIDFSGALKSLFESNWWFFFLSVLALVLSKIVAAFRLNINFKNINIHVSQWSNIKLFWLGMFLNLFLPGAITGDAYKVILLKKKFKASYKKTTAAVLLDRLSGLLALGVLLTLSGVFVLNDSTFNVLLTFSSVIAIAGMYFFVRLFQKDFLPGFWKTFFIGIAVQLLMVVSLYCILLSLGIASNLTEWIFIFLIAAVISVLPLSLGGGLGTREVAFAEGASYFHLDPQTGVTISLLFYAVNIIASLPGLYYNFSDPLKDKREGSLVSV